MVLCTLYLCEEKASMNKKNKNTINLLFLGKIFIFTVKQTEMNGEVLKAWFCSAPKRVQ